MARETQPSVSSFCGVSVLGAADAASSRALAGLRERERERRSLPKPPTYRSSSFPPAPQNLEQPLHACIGALLDKKLPDGPVCLLSASCSGDGLILIIEMLCSGDRERDEKRRAEGRGG